MDVFETLESRVVRLVEAYGSLKGRVAELEEENAKLRGSGDETERLRGRVAELETERAEVARRLERVLEKLAALEM